MIDPIAMDAVREHLANVAGITRIIWPNEAAKVAPPYVVFDFGVSNTDPITIDGEERVEVRPLVSVYVESDTFTTAQDTTLWAIAQAFKIGTRVESGGTVYAESLRTPEADSGEANGKLFRRSLTLRLAVDQTA